MIHWRTTAGGIATGMALAGKAVENYSHGDILGGTLFVVGAIGAIFFGANAADAIKTIEK